MAGISDTLARIEALRRPGRAPANDCLTDLTGFGRNPGALRARAFVPAGLARDAALVVVLHGCTQTAAGYDAGSGWSRLAEREGFALLFPEQVRANNANGCFNWFEAADIARAGGEAESIAQMTEAMVTRHGLDPARVFVTGLSAGGAMAAAMLATRPDLFAAGAIIGGLPYACANGVREALERMRGRGLPDAAAAAAAVRGVGPGSSGRRPRVSLWHGGADATVVPAVMTAHGRQWRGVHGLGETPDAVAHGSGWERRRWGGTAEEPLVEEWLLAGMGHGVPLDPAGADGLGTAGPFMLDVGIDSTALIAAGWGLTQAEAPMAAHHPKAPLASAISAVPAGAQAIIDKALRAAGLLR